MTILKIKRDLWIWMWIIAMCIITSNCAQAEVMANALRDWDPATLQGTIMETGRDYIVVAEKWVYLMDASRAGKTIKPRIIDKNGINIDKNGLKVGKVVLVKGGLAYDDKKKQDVLLATEIYILDKPIDPNIESQRKKYLTPAKPL